MTFEVIIAPDRERANAYALDREWQIIDRIAHKWVRRLPNRPYSPFTRAEDFIEVHFAATPMALDDVPPSTPIHVAGFERGIPAAWAKALSRHNVVTEPA